MPLIRHLGSLDADCASDIYALTVFGGPIIKLSGAADVLTFANQVSLDYCVQTAGVDAMTLAAPVAADDGKVVSVFSDSTNAHTITATSLLAAGVALKTTATFAAFKGAGVVLRAFNGLWHVVSSPGITLT